MSKTKINAFLEFQKTLTDAELGALVREHLSESAHQGWDGFNSRDLTGIGRLLEDVEIYGKNRTAIPLPFAELRAQVEKAIGKTLIEENDTLIDEFLQNLEDAVRGHLAETPYGTEQEEAEQTDLLAYLIHEKLAAHLNPRIS